MSEQTARDLEAARKLIADPSAWVKGVPPIGCFCAETAIAMACNGDPQNYDSDQAWRALDALRDAINDAAIFRWNDAPERTHAEVLAAFDRAIASERNA